MAEITRRIVDCQVRKTPGAERTLTFTASTEQVARDGDIIRTKGWITEEFEKNPVFLWSHNPSVPALGRATATRKITRGKNKRLEIDVEFAGLEQLHDLAEQVYLLYESGFLRAVSVGYMTLKRKELTEEQHAKLGLGPYGSEWIETELYELSAVNVPADTDALVQNDALPDEVREAALAVRAAETGAQDTSSDTINWRDEFAEIVQDQLETLGANLFTEIRVEFTQQLDDLRDDLSRASRDPDDGGIAKAEPRTEGTPEAEHSEEADLYGIEDERLRLSNPDDKEDDLR